MGLRPIWMTRQVSDHFGLHRKFLFHKITKKMDQRTELKNRKRKKWKGGRGLKQAHIISVLLTMHASELVQSE